MKHFARIVSILMLLYIMTACESENQQSEESFQSETSETVTFPTAEEPTEPEIPVNDISRIDFDYFEDKMDNDTWYAFQGYIPVLRGKAEFTLSLESQESESEKRAQETTDLTGYFSMNGETGDSITLSKFSVFDLDNDGIQELILCFDNLGGQYMALHEKDGTFFAADFVHRGLQSLSLKGIYIASGGAGCIHYRTLAFEENRFIEYEIANTDYNSQKACQEYFIDGEQVDKDTYAAWEQGHLLQYSVPWYETLEDEKWSCKTYNYSEWGTDKEELL